MSDRKIFLTIIIFCSLQSMLFAQSTDSPSNEVLTWTGFKIQKKITKNFGVFLAPEVRTFGREVERYLGDVGVKYKIFDWLDAGITYRFAKDAKNKGGFKTSHRFAFDLKTGASYGNFDPEFRLRFTNKYDVKDDETRRNLRFKGGINYDIPKSKITPFLQTEMFYKLNKSTWSKYRLGTGAALKISKANEFQLAYILQKDFGEVDNEHIIALGYKFKF